MRLLPQKTNSNSITNWTIVIAGRHHPNNLKGKDRIVNFLRNVAIAATAVAAMLGAAQAGDRHIVVASTTSTENSGLFSHILPMFEAATGIEARVVAVGTGQAIKIAERGDADVLFVHDAPSEKRFVDAGFGIDRREVMYNDFVIVGPATDPAGIEGASFASAAFGMIAKASAPFVSRGDDSGTNKAELRIWKAAGIDAQAASGGWYREIGAGMGAALNTSAASDAYTLSDRGTWLAFRNRRNLRLLFAGDPKLENRYAVIAVNPARHPHVRVAAARRFIDWITGPEGQAAIGAYRLDGEVLFRPAADPR